MASFISRQRIHVESSSELNLRFARLHLGGAYFGAIFSSCFGRRTLRPAGVLTAYPCCCWASTLVKVAITTLALPARGAKPATTLQI